MSGQRIACGTADWRIVREAGISVPHSKRTGDHSENGPAQSAWALRVVARTTPPCGVRVAVGVGVADSPRTHLRSV